MSLGMGHSATSVQAAMASNSTGTGFSSGWGGRRAGVRGAGAHAATDATRTDLPASGLRSGSTLGPVPAEELRQGGAGGEIAGQVREHVT